MALAVASFRRVAGSTRLTTNLARRGSRIGGATWPHSVADLFHVARPGRRAADLAAQRDAIFRAVHGAPITQLLPIAVTRGLPTYGAKGSRGAELTARRIAPNFSATASDHARFPLIAIRRVERAVRGIARVQVARVGVLATVVVCVLARVLTAVRSNVRGVDPGVVDRSHRALTVEAASSALTSRVVRAPITFPAEADGFRASCARALRIGTAGRRRTADPIKGTARRVDALSRQASVALAVEPSASEADLHPKLRVARGALHAAARDLGSAHVAKDDEYA